MKRAAVLLLSPCLLMAAVALADTDGADARGAVAASSTDPKASRDRVRRQRAAAAARLDALRADADEVEQALEDLSANTTGREADLRTARTAEEQANKNLLAAQAEVDTVRGRIDVLSASAKQAALRAFTSSGDSNLFSTLLATAAVTVGVEEVLYDLAVGDVSSALDELDSARRELEALRRKAQRAAGAATKRREKVEQRLAELAEARKQQQALGERIEQRIEDALSEAEALADLDATLSRRIAERELALARRARALAAAAGIKNARVNRDGRIKVPVIPSAKNGLVRVNGVLVDRSIGEKFATLVAWAAEDGIRLSGGGYRSAQDQIWLRKLHCGTSDYDVWEKPSWECSPPTARPGFSLHERGLAIDIRCNGRLLSRYSDPCFAWMAEHAPKVGLYNDVTGREAWHWSTTGG